MMTRELNHDQAKALAVLVASLRDGWDVAGIRKALWDARTKGTPDQVAHAAITAAMNPTNRTPAVIGHDGPHWTQARPVETAAANYDRCPIPGHTSYPAWHCGACRSDDLATNEPRTPAPTTDPATYTRWAQAARDALKETR